MIKGRLWYVRSDSKLFVEMQKGQEREQYKYQVGSECAGVFCDGRTFFYGTITGYTKTGVILKDWRFCQNVN